VNRLFQVSTIRFPTLFLMTLAGLILAVLVVLPYAASTSGPEGGKPALQALNGDGVLTILGHLGGETRGLCAVDGYIYMGMGPELLVFDVANPAETHPVGRLMLTELIEGIDAAGDLVVVAAGKAGVRVISVANPSQPVELGAYAPADFTALDVHLAGDRLYVAGGQQGALLLSLSNPELPVLLDSVDTPGNAQGVDATGNLIFVADGDAGGFRVLERVGDSLTPAGSLDTPGQAEAVLAHEGEEGGPHIVYVADGVAGVHVVDVHIPGSPHIWGSVDTPAYAHDVARSGHYLYAADDTGGIRVIVAADPEHPVEVNHIDGRGSVTSIDADETLAYAGASGLRVYSLTDGSHPVTIGTRR